MGQKNKGFKQIDPRVNFPKLEEEILAFWDRENIFQKSLEKNEKGERYVFYEGPPTANGKPHIGHFITRIFKDIFPRFKTMQGYYVLRKGGWDTHGLPVEVEVEKSLGISGKEQIENLVPGDQFASIVKFNELCRESVWKYVDLWEKMIKRVGNWIDLENAYITYHKEYVESLWWSLKELHGKGLLYLGYKVVPYCPRCETPLSSHEVAQDYKTTKDTSVYVKFPFLDKENTFIVAWTTTPWTLPGNVALAVDLNLEYVKVEHEGQTLIMAKEAAERLVYNKVVEELKGKDLVGKKYKPLYDFLEKKFVDNKNLHTIVAADFVETGQGTGVVHTAVMYGEEDFNLGKEIGLPTYHTVNKQGKFTEETGWLVGKYVREANPEIISDLKEQGLLLREEVIEHEYPHCWRCHNPLIYYALKSWFIKTTEVKDQLIKNNDSVNWVPDYIKNGRMKNWYETLIDWSLSRYRYWGTPLPIWSCQECGENIAIGSISELKEKATNKDIDWEKFDLHRPWVDQVKIKCEKCGGEMGRVSDVIDVWYDSGAMPFAQWHYPFENEKIFKEQFPADFISEAIDQTRGWFFSLQAISTMLFEKSPYKRVVVFAHALDKEGKKMSKHLGNVVDPWETFEEYGADTARWFFFSSVSIGTPYRVSLDAIGEARRRFLLILWNVYNYFVTQANKEEWNSNLLVGEKKNILDRWVLAKLEVLKKSVTESLEEYDTYTASKAIEGFVVNDLSQWYVRRSRDRFSQLSENEDDRMQGYSTLWEVLVTLTKLLGPFVPFISESIYKNLTGEESVHLSDWPKYKDLSEEEKQLIKEMDIVRVVVEKGHAARKEVGIPVRQPLAQLNVNYAEDVNEDLLRLIQDELNVKNVAWNAGPADMETSLDTEITPELKEEGKTRELARQIQDERKKLGASLEAKVIVTAPWLPESAELLEWIKKRVLAEEIKRGAEFEVKIL